MSKLNPVTLFFCITLALQSFAAAQGLPDPYSPSPKSTDPPSAYGLPLSDSVPVSTNPSFNPPSPDVARGMAERVMSDLDSLSDTIQKNLRFASELGARIEKLKGDINQLVAERDRVLDDLRKGFFCSTCGKAKSEFGSDQAFWEHIAEGRSQGRHAVPATKEQFDAKNAEYDRKVRAAEVEKANCEQGVREKLAENQDAYGQMQHGLNLWRTAISVEEDAIRARDAAEKRKLQDEISEAERQIRRIDGELRKERDPDAVTTLAAARNTWENIRRKAADDAARRISYLDEELRQAGARHQEEYGRVRQFIGRTDDYLLWARTSLNFLPTLNVTLHKVSIYMSPGQLGVKFRFGKIVSGGFQVTTDDTSQEAQAFLDLFGLRVSAGNRTESTPDGRTLTFPTADVGRPKTPKGNNLKIKPIYKDEKPKTSLPLP